MSSKEAAGRGRAKSFSFNSETSLGGEVFMFAMVATRLLIATLAISECFPVFGGALFSAIKELR